MVPTGESPWAHTQSSSPCAPSIYPEPGTGPLEPVKTSVYPVPEDTCVTPQPHSPDSPQSSSGAPSAFLWWGHGSRAVPPDWALCFSPRPVQCPASPPRTSGPCLSPLMWPSSPGLSPHAAPSMASSKAIVSSSGHSTWMGVSLPGAKAGAQAERCRVNGGLCPRFPRGVQQRRGPSFCTYDPSQSQTPGWVTSVVGGGTPAAARRQSVGNGWSCGGACVSLM